MSFAQLVWKTSVSLLWPGSETRMAERKSTAEWETYPRNLSNFWGCQAEWESYRNHMSEASPRLFVQDDDTSAVEAINPNGTDPSDTDTAGSFC